MQISLKGLMQRRSGNISHRNGALLPVEKFSKYKRPQSSMFPGLKGFYCAGKWREIKKKTAGAMQQTLCEEKTAESFSESNGPSQQMFLLIIQISAPNWTFAS